MDLKEEKEEIKIQLFKIASEIRKLQGKIGGHKAHYNKLNDRLMELDRLIDKEK